MTRAVHIVCHTCATRTFEDSGSWLYSQGNTQHEWLIPAEFVAAREPLENFHPTHDVETAVLD